MEHDIQPIHNLRVRALSQQSHNRPLGEGGKWMDLRKIISTNISLENDQRPVPDK